MLKEGINKIANIKGSSDSQIWWILKRIAIVVFENLLSQQFFKVHFRCLRRLIWCLGDTKLLVILSFTGNFSSFIANIKREWADSLLRIYIRTRNWLYKQNELASREAASLMTSLFPSSLLSWRVCNLKLFTTIKHKLLQSCLEKD